MKKWIIGIGVIAIFIILFQFDRNKDEVQGEFRTAGKEGYVLRKGEQIYFAAAEQFETKEQLQVYIAEQMKKEHPTDIILQFEDKDAYKQLQTGDKIEVWSSQILESYPSKMIVERFVVRDKNTE